MTLTLVFEHRTKADKTITGAQFEITEGLTWRKQSKVYGSGGEISNVELLGGLQDQKRAIVSNQYRLPMIHQEVVQGFQEWYCS